MRSIVLLSLLLAAGIVSSAGRAQRSSPTGTAPNPDEDSRHGAVLCAWTLYREALEVGDVCLHGGDADFQAGLRAAIGRIDRFIMRNLPASPDRLAEFERGRVLMDPPTRLCTPEPLRIYKVLQLQGVDNLDKSVAGLLAVPRRPMASPCL